MTSIADGSVIIQSTSESVPSTPCWFGEVALMAAIFVSMALTKISERVRFARRRFGHYEVIDFLAVLFGYALSGERTLEAFYERVHPFAALSWPLRTRSLACPFNAFPLFSRSDPEPVEALRTLFLEDLLGRQQTSSSSPVGSPIEQESCGRCSTLMGHVRLPDNAPCPRPRTTCSPASAG